MTPPYKGFPNSIRRADHSDQSRMPKGCYSPTRAPERIVSGDSPQKAPDANASGASFMELQVVLDLLDHGGVLFLGQVLAAGVHGEGRAPLELVGLVLGNQVEVQVAAAVAVGAVVDLVGMEGLVQGVGSLVHVGEVGVAILVGDVDHLRNVILVGHDDTAGMALLLEQDELADAQVADLDAEAGQDLAAHAVAAVAIFHWNYPLNFFDGIIIPHRCGKCKAKPQKMIKFLYGLVETGSVVPL